MAEWLYEAGIGENRAILVEDDNARVATSPGRGCAARGAAYPRIVEAAIELPGEIRFGAVIAGRLAAILVSGRRGLVETEAGEVLVEPLPSALTEGQRVRVEIVREPIPEPGRAKRAKGRITDSAEREGASLIARIGTARTVRATDPDLFEQAGWSELLEEAATGEIAFSGGNLRMSLTPAMTLFDVDGALPPPELAVLGAGAAGRAVRRLGIGGSIGIDLPTLASRTERQSVAAALDAVLPQPFERTAVNGFGFLQIVRRRERASLPELIRDDPAAVTARALIRRAERSGGAGERMLTAAPAVLARIEAHPDWLAALSRRLGAPIALRADPGLAISAGHVHAEHA